MFLYIVHLGRLSYPSLLLSRSLHSVGYIFPFLPWFLVLFFPQLVKPSQTTTLPSCISFSLGWFLSLPPVQCYKYPYIALQNYKPLKVMKKCPTTLSQRNAKLRYFCFYLSGWMTYTLKDIRRNLSQTYLPTDDKYKFRENIKCSYLKTSEDKQEKAMAHHSSTLAWKIPWTEGLVGCSPWGR